jgi:predicted small lipoprotein YifL
MSPCLSLPRLVLLAGLFVVGLSACGRRGAPEAPPVAAVEQGQNAAPAAGTLPSPVGTTRSNRQQGYVIPNEPFILDPLL